MPRRLLAAAVVLAAGPLVAADPPARYAVLAGVNQYDHPKVTPLTYAGNDAAEMGEVLARAGYQVAVLTQQAGDPRLAPTKANIEREIARVLGLCKKGDLVVVGLSGHGFQFGGQKDGFFLPSDGKPFPDRTDTMVSLGRLYKDLDQSNAGMKVLLVDACRVDPAAPKAKGAAKGVTADSAPPPPKGVAALFSCSAGEASWEASDVKHGVFFATVIDGLNGKARDGDGVVTFAGLAGYVNRQVPGRVARLVGDGVAQTPNLRADYSAEPVLSSRADWRALLAGDKLDGWRPLGAGDWAVKDGVLAAAGKGPGWLATADEFADFELELEYRLPKGGNSGVFLRAWADGPVYGGDFVEVQLLDDAAHPGNPWPNGAVFQQAAPARATAAPAEKWNAASVRAAGPRVTVTINGTACQDRDVKFPRARGLIGLQKHASAVEFRNVRVREVAGK